MKVLVTGSTGYIGGRLVPLLLQHGVEVRCMSRDPSQLTLDTWRDRVEIVAADALDPASLGEALEGCDAAYYLIHAMAASPKQFAEEGRQAAANFARAADRAGLERIVYLGGLGSDLDDLSEHLDSRQEVGRLLASGRTPVVELRAAVIIGSGSMSFEMIRHLTEVLPIIMTPPWVRTRCQPIAVRNVLEILISVLDHADPTDRIYEIGGPEILTYQEMMQVYAEVAGLHRRPVVPLPLFSARLSPMLVGLVTSLPAGISRVLIESLLNDVVVTKESPPGFDPADLMPYREALARALTRISNADVETRWSDAVSSPAAPAPGDPVWSGATMEVDRRVVESSAPPNDLFWAVTRIGGDVGYYAMNWAWMIRGWADQVIGGVGLRRGRRDPEDLRPGEALDFFRVAEIDPERRHLLLQAEMKVPGTAWLEWTVEPTDEGSRLTQVAQFAPRGVAGRSYWWGLLPFHAPIFRKMSHKIARTAEQRGRVQRRGSRKDLLVDLWGRLSNPSQAIETLATQGFAATHGDAESAESMLSTAAGCTQREPLEEEGRLSNPVQRRLSPNDVDDLITAYRAGTTIDQLAANYRIHRTTVAAHLDRHQIPRHDEQSAWDDDTLHEATTLYGTGVSLAHVAARYNIDAQTVANRFRRAGISVRPRRGWPSSTQV